MRTGVLERDGHGLKAVLTTGKAVHSRGGGGLEPSADPALQGMSGTPACRLDLGGIAFIFLRRLLYESI